uniref:TOG domain-containing protein n=1 Tax=Gongylonema pulchrum TaxID=637853 RepID=A0A183DFR8_9BILA
LFINEEFFRNEKLSAIEIIVSLAELSPNTVVGNIQAVIRGLLNECKNLRSTVSRTAIVAFGALFKNLKTVLDSDIEKYTSPGRALNALVAAGAKQVFFYTSKNNMIRASCSSLLIKLLERIGSANAVNSAELPQFINTLLLFAKDPNGTVRYNGKYGIKLLSEVRTPLNYYF